MRAQQDTFKTHAKRTHYVCARHEAFLKTYAERTHHLSARREVKKNVCQSFEPLVRAPRYTLMPILLITYARAMDFLKRMPIVFMRLSWT